MTKAYLDTSGCFMFEDNEDTRRIDRIMLDILVANPDLNILRGWTDGIKQDTGDYFVFLNHADLSRISPEDTQVLYGLLRKGFAEANYEVINEDDADSDWFFRVGFASHYFQLRKNS